MPKSLQLAVRANMLAACDGKPGVDNVVDGVLDDPRECDYDIAAMQCGAPTADPAACLTAPQVQALKTAQNGRRKSTGEVVAFGYPDGIGGNFFPTEKTSPDNPQGSWSNQSAASGIHSSNWMSDAALGRIEPATRQNGCVTVADPPPPFGLVQGWAALASTCSAAVMTVSTEATFTPAKSPHFIAVGAGAGAGAAANPSPPPPHEDSRTALQLAPSAATRMAKSLFIMSPLWGR